MSIKIEKLAGNELDACIAIRIRQLREEGAKEETTLLSGMYTHPNYRRQGIAKALLEKVIEEARAYGCSTIQITASDMGIKLYSAYGFEPNRNFMQYRLQSEQIQ